MKQAAVSARHRAVALGSVAALVVAACSSGSDGVASVELTQPSASAPVTSSTTAAPKASGDAFATASLDAVEVEPLDRVGVSGVEVGTPMVAAFPVGDDAWDSTPLFVDDVGPYFLAPPDVSDPVGGGQIGILLTDGTSLSEPLPLTIVPLGEQPGGFDREIEALETSVDEDARLYGSSWDELLATPVEELPRELTGLKIVQSLIDDGAGGGAVGSYATLDPEAASILDALMVKIALTAPIDLELPEDAFPPGSAPVGFANTSSVASAAPSSPASPSSRVSLPRGLRAAPSPTFGGADCIPFPTEANVDAARLSEMMLKSKLGAIATDSSQGPGRYLAASELAFGVAAALETVGSAGKSKIGAAILQGVAARKMQHALNAGVMPSFFTDIDAEIDETQHEEDREEPGRWTKVWVTAQSTGYSLDADIAGALIDGAGGVLAKNAGLPEGSLIDVEAGAATGEVKNAVNDVLGPTSTISFCPNTWRVDIAGEEWSWARPVRALFTVDNAALTFENRTEIGRDTLRFAPWPFRFGGATISSDVPISTEAITVTSSPHLVWVDEPGETVGITTEIDHAVDTELKWTNPKGRWTDSPDATTSGSARRPLLTPSSPDDYPFTIEVEATTDTGLRALPGAPRRSDAIEVRLAPIIVLPNPGAVQTRKMLGYTATNREGELIAVTWSATGGRIVSSGHGTATYTAGGVEGTFEVTARLESNPQVFVTVLVTIADPCLIGSWRVDAQYFADEMMRLSDEPITVSPAGGTWDLTIADDLSFVSTQTEWSLQFEGGGASGRIVTNDTQTGTMQATSDEILSVTTTGRDFSGRLEYPGGSIDLDPESVPLETEFNPGTYECEAGRMYVYSGGATFAFDEL
jgi:hypothetical protein